jgi:hypothetical protein
MGMSRDSYSTETSTEDVVLTGFRKLGGAECCPEVHTWFWGAESGPSLG